MGFMNKEAKKARREAEAARAEASQLRADSQRKVKAEREKVQRNLIRGVKGRFNPFEVLPGGETLGAPEKGKGK